MDRSRILNESNKRFDFKSRNKSRISINGRAIFERNGIGGRSRFVRLFKKIKLINKAKINRRT